MNGAEATTWWGYSVSMDIKPKSLNVVRETEHFLITATGQRTKKQSAWQKWFPTRLEALAWRKQSAEMRRDHGDWEVRDSRRQIYAIAALEREARR